MDYFAPFQDELRLVFNRVAELARQFPPPLDRRAERYIAPLLDSGDASKNYICYLLPYWLQDLTGLPLEECRRLSVACTFGMLHFFIQDDMMDTASFDREDIPLSQLFYAEMHKLLLGLFPSGSEFWRYYDGYMREWASGVTNEASSDYFRHAPLRIAWKASPVKAGSTGALLLAGQAGRIPVVEKAVDLCLATLQMADDWLDWREDLAAGCYNSFLSYIRQTRPEEEPLTEGLVKKYIYVQGLLGGYADRAHSNFRQFMELDLPIAHLIAYHRTISDRLRSASARIDSRSGSLLSGGLYYFLSKNIKK